MNSANCVIALVFLMFSSLAASAQTCDLAQLATNVNSRVFRDTDAIETVQRGLKALGGMSAWSNIETSRMTVKVLKAERDTPIQAIWLQDLSNEKKIRSATMAEDHQYMESDSDEPRVAKLHDRTISVPPSPPLGQIAVENPGIVLSFAMRSGGVSVCKPSIAEIKQIPGDVTWIRITRGGKYMAEVIDVAFSKENGLPTRLRRLRPRLALFAPPVWQDAYFDSFQKIDGLQVPLKMYWTESNIAPITITVISVEFNSKLTSSDFKELAK